MVNFDRVTKRQGVKYRIDEWKFLLSLGFVVVCLTSSCCTHKPSGAIYLDHGEVFTRERLVNSVVMRATTHGRRVNTGRPRLLESLPCAFPRNSA